jgi:transposase InsO family protein
VTADVHLVAAEANASVTAVCRVLDVPRSTAYARRAQGPSARQSDTDKLDVEIAATFREHKGRYGSPRVHRVLRARRPVSRKRIAARMRALGLWARRPKRFRRTTSTRCDTELALAALEHAVARRRPGPGLLHHTDRGSTYTASDYQARLASRRSV